MRESWRFSSSSSAMPAEISTFSLPHDEYPEISGANKKGEVMS
jgi:hypothetical protein